jgi:IclR family pca regulon transcriptional regulator
LLSTLPNERLETAINETTFRKLTPNTLDEKELRDELLNVRQQGYAIVDQELELGMRAVAVPVYDRRNQVRFALNVSSHVSSSSLEQVRDQFIPVMLQAAKDMSKVIP